jgi:hypothetical protein
MYSVGFTGVTISAVQDLIAIYAGANMALELHMIKLSQVTQSTIGGLKLRIRHATATVTSGSGGNSATPNPVLPNDAAATATARINDTTQATTSGSFKDLPDGWDLPFGFLWMPPESGRIVIKPNEALILSLDSTPSALVASGYAFFGELF